MVMKRYKDSHGQYYWKDEEQAKVAEAISVSAEPVVVDAPVVAKKGKFKK